MTDYYAPNQQTVRGDESGPAEEGSGGSPPVEGTGGGDVIQPVDGEMFDPYDYTVAEVQAYLAAHPEETARVLEAERAGKNRTTLVEGT